MSMTKTPPLIKVTFRIKDDVIGLSNYADMVVFDKEKTLIAIRFGGYPESVQAMSDAILGGCTLELMNPDTGGKIKVDSKGRRLYDCKTSHDGLYAESMLFLGDDTLQSLALESEDKSEKETVSADRNLYFYCNDEDELYSQLDRKLAVPLIPEFKDFFITELRQRNLLHKLQVHCLGHTFQGWHMKVSADEKEIAEVLEDGLKNGQIAIPGFHGNTENAFSEIRSFTEYLNQFGTRIADRIKTCFPPLFNPAEEPLSDSLIKVNRFIEEHAGYSLFDAQLGAAEALKRRLETDRLSLLVAECGTGKSKIGAAALYAYQHGKSKQKTARKAFNVIICPSHLTGKWVRELYETVPDCFAQAVSTMSDVDKLYEVYQRENKTVYCILSKETARNGYMRQPSVTWNRLKKGFICPHCGEVQEKKVFDDGSSYTVNADSLFFQNENNKNHKCQFCGEPLWSMLNPNVLAPEKTEWVRIGGYGFVHRRFANSAYVTCKNKEFQVKIAEVCNNPSGIFPAVGAYSRFPLSSYIKRRLKRIDAVIIDELHQYSGESAQGQAMAELAGISDKVIGMTATLINGYAKGLFYLLFRMKAHLMLLDSQSFHAPRAFCEQYGVIEELFEVDAAEYNSASKSSKRKVREKFLPGASPLVYSRFLMENAVFLSLTDMGKELPDYEEIPIPCTLSGEVETEYSCLEAEFKRIMKQDAKIGNRILSAYLNLLSAYPDQPYGHEPIYNPLLHNKRDEPPLIVPKDIGDITTLHPKDEALIELVERKVAAGERVIVYTAWTRLDTQTKFHKLFTEKGIQASILDRKIPPAKREAWVDKRVAEGVKVLIVNPSLVETGLDLNAFTTLVFFNVAFNLYIFRQASRRSWRINQTAPKVEIYMLYYKQTMQQRALKLMASKLSAATVIEGQISDEGLAAMSDCEDLTTQLAKELMLGIKDNVEDLADNFKKMAILGNRKDKKTEAVQTVEPAEKVITQEAQPKAVPAVVSFFPQTAKPKTKGNTDTGQLSIFDLLAS